MNEFRSHYQSRCLSRFNSVKRKQLERLRQRSDWFLSPIVRERNNSRKGKGDWELHPFGRNVVQASSDHCRNGSDDCKNNCGNSTGHNGSKRALQQKNSGNSTVTKASSEGAVPETFSDGDSVFTDNTSRSESPASEPVWSRVLKVHSRDAIQSDTIAEFVLPEMSFEGGSSIADLSIDSHDSISGHYFVDLSPSLARDRVFEEVQEEEGMKKFDEEDDEDDDDDNTTPTGMQEDDDTVVVSVPDLQRQVSTEPQISCCEELDKDSSADSFYECAEVIEQIREEQGDNPETEDPELPMPGALKGRELIQGQQFTQRTLEPGEVAEKTDDVRVDRDVEKEEVLSKSLETEVSEGDFQCFLVERTYGDKFPNS